MIMKINKGFTLVEALVAITVLVIGVLGPLTIAARGIADGLYAKNELAAKYLAQEAIEVVANKRASNIQNGDAWLTGINDPPPETVTLSGVPFTRTVTVTLSNDVPDELKAVVKIDWQNKDMPRALTMTEHFYRRP